MTTGSGQPDWPAGSYCSDQPGCGMQTGWIWLAALSPDLAEAGVASVRLGAMGRAPSSPQEKAAPRRRRRRRYETGAISRRPSSASIRATRCLEGPGGRDVLVEALLRRGTGKLDRAGSEVNAIETGWLPSPTDPGFVLHELPLLRMRALLAQDARR